MKKHRWGLMALLTQIVKRTGLLVVASLLLHGGACAQEDVSFPAPSDTEPVVEVTTMPEEATVPEPTPAPLPIAESEAGIPHEITFTTKDGQIICGTYTRSAAREDSDTVILVHEKSSDRSQWDGFVPMLLQ